MMTTPHIVEVRRELSSIIGMTEDNIRVRTDMLYRQPKLRDILPGRDGGTGNAGLLATPAATALVTLTAMLGYSRAKIAPEVLKLWEARLVTPTGNPIEKCKTAGAVLTLLLADKEVRDRLIFFEVDKRAPHIAFIFGDPALLASNTPLSVMEWQARIDNMVTNGKLARTFYAPYQPAAWERRMELARVKGEMAQICRLGVETLHKLAALIARDEIEGTA